MTATAIPSSSVRLGLMPPLTGLVETYGQEIVWAARIAVDEINAQGGVLGHPLELIIEDDGSLPDTAVPAAERLIDVHGCVAIIGNLLSNSRIAVSSMVSEPRRVPYLNFSFYEGSIFGRYFFHFAALPNQQIDKMVPYMAQHFGPKMYFAGSNYEWPLGSIDAAKRALLACGGDIVGEEYLPIGTDEIDGLLDRVAHSGADVFVPYFAGNDQINLLTRFSECGLKKRMAVVMGHYDEAMVGNLPPDVREGFYSSNTYFMSVDTPQNRQYLGQLAALPGVTGIWPQGNGVLTNFGEGTYLCVHAFARAANAAQSLDAEALVAALENITVSGPQGIVTMDASTHHAHVNTYLSRCNADGTFTIIEKFGINPPEIPERYRGNFGHLLGRPVDVHSTDEHVPPFSSAVASIDAAGYIEFVNQTFLHLWEYKLTDDVLIGQHISSLLRLSAAEGTLIANVIAAGRSWYGHLTARLATGANKRISVSLEPIISGDAKRTSFVFSCLDTFDESHQKRMEQILSIADIAIIATDANGLIVMANRGAARLFGYNSEVLIGLSVHLLLPPQFRNRHDIYLQQFAKSEQTEIPMGKRGTIAGYRKDGSVFPAEASLSKFTADNEMVLVVSLRDITERKQSEDELVWRANHDQLTGLPNRALLSERLATALLRSKRHGNSVALMFIDLDNFKAINDSYGHEAGDQMLTIVARRLVDQARPGDIVARLGGDEFVVLCEQINEPSAISSLADRINSSLREPFIIDGKTLFISASIGMAIGDGSAITPDDMLRHADTAMYVVKERGRDGWHFFSDELQEKASRRIAVTNGLRTALEQNEMRLVCQPIVNTQTGRICGAELLLRWLPSSGDVSPDFFIPIAEATGSIQSIGGWVFSHACRIEADLQRRFGSDKPYVSVNISARQLNDEKLAAKFGAKLSEYGADPSNIILEITETSLMSDAEPNLRILQQLADLGMRVAVDDFGTGYSSLSQLLRLPVTTIKIDRAFIDGLDHKDESHSITTAVVSMAKALSMKQIAEGVETYAELVVLRAIDCDYVQGYYFHRPMPEEQFVATFEKELGIIRTGSHKNKQDE